MMGAISRVYVGRESCVARTLLFAWFWPASNPAAPSSITTATSRVLIADPRCNIPLPSSPLVQPAAHRARLAPPHRDRALLALASRVRTLHTSHQSDRDTPRHPFDRRRLPPA